VATGACSVPDVCPVIATVFCHFLTHTTTYLLPHRFYDGGDLCPFLQRPHPYLHLPPPPLQVSAADQKCLSIERLKPSFATHVVAIHFPKSGGVTALRFPTAFAHRAPPGPVSPLFPPPPASAPTMVIWETSAPAMDAAGGEFGAK
jgi:hypothetical protein